MITFRDLGRAGRLGNQLWQIASTIGIAEQRGDEARFPFWRYRPYFSIPDRYFPDSTLLGTETLHGYLQDLRHLRGVEDTIRRYFQPSPEVERSLRRRFAPLLALNHRTAVHVRRGDYLTKPDFHPFPGLDYYESAMTIASPPFVVFSDDLAWCRSHFARDCIFIEHNRDYETLFLSAMCDEHIIANSTFAWWAAWLAGSRMILPERWFGPRATTDPRVFLPDNAVVL